MEGGEEVFAEGEAATMRKTAVLVPGQRLIFHKNRGFQD